VEIEKHPHAHGDGDASCLVRDGGLSQDRGSTAAGDALHPLGVRAIVFHGRRQRQLFVLFLWLSVSDGFSYLLSSTLVPVLSIRVMRQVGAREESAGLFERFRGAYGRLVSWLLRFRWPLIVGYAAGIWWTSPLRSAENRNEIFHWLRQVKSSANPSQQGRASSERR
jgi:hypothetical protein